MKRSARRRARSDVVAYVINADNNRGSQLAGELVALRGSEPTLGIVGIIEAIGNRLPALPGMDRLVGAGPSRGNIGAYVSTHLLGGTPLRARWHDLRRTWPRTEGPPEPHPARSYTELLDLGRVQAVVAHIPPDCPGSEAARREAVDSLVHLFAPWTRPGWKALRVIQRRWRRDRPRLLFIDANGMKAEICQRADLKAAGDGPDFVLYGGDVRVDEERYLESFKPIGGAPVPFRGDHRRVLRTVLSIDTKYLPKETRHA